MTRFLCAALFLSLCSLPAMDISAQQTKPAKKVDAVIESLKNTAWKSPVTPDQLFLVLAFDADGSGAISWRTTVVPDQPLGGRAHRFQSIEKQGKIYYILAKPPPQPGINFTPTRWVLEASADKMKLTVKGESNKKYTLFKQERNE